MDASHVDSRRWSIEEGDRMKRLVAVLLFLGSLVAVVAITHALPSSPGASLFVDDGGGGDRDPNGRSPEGRGDRHDRGNRESADLSFSSLLETGGTVGPQVLIVGAFAVSVERSRRKRNADRRSVIGRAAN
jgi:hypothetical protein